MELPELSSLTKKELHALAWEHKGTPAVQPIYDEMMRRTEGKPGISLDDPDWEAKTKKMLENAIKDMEDG